MTQKGILWTPSGLAVEVNPKHVVRKYAHVCWRVAGSAPFWKGTPPLEFNGSASRAPVYATKQTGIAALDKGHVFRWAIQPCVKNKRQGCVFQLCPDIEANVARGMPLRKGCSKGDPAVLDARGHWLRRVFVQLQVVRTCSSILFKRMRLRRIS